MKETAQILLEATPRSLIIMDEVGRGTSTTDGISLALSILDHLSKVNKSLCIFATHYHELAGLIEKNKIKHISYHQTSSTLDSKERLTCLYRIIPGVMDCSHGIEVAKMAGLPASVIKKAKSIYKTLDTNILG
jgi:DNA mismatch repair protein MutS